MFSAVLFFFKQKTAYEMRISDWSSDVCSSDLYRWVVPSGRSRILGLDGYGWHHERGDARADHWRAVRGRVDGAFHRLAPHHGRRSSGLRCQRITHAPLDPDRKNRPARAAHPAGIRSEEHTSELQSLMSIPYAVFCLKKKKNSTLN